MSTAHHLRGEVCKPRASCTGMHRWNEPIREEAWRTTRVVVAEAMYYTNERSIPKIDVILTSSQNKQKISLTTPASLLYFTLAEPSDQGGRSWVFKVCSGSGSLDESSSQ